MAWIGYSLQRLHLHGMALQSGYANTISLSVLIILAIYNLIFFLILRRQQQLIASIQETAQEIINQANKTFSIEAKLQKSDLVLSKATSYAHIGIWEYDLESKQTYWSEELFRILGQVPKELSPGANYFIHLLSEEEYELYRDHATKVVRDKKPADLEVTIHQPEGEDIEIWMTIHPQMDENGTVTGIWGLAQDITLIKTAEQELLVLNRALQMVLTCNQVITRSTEEQEMIENVSKTITDIGGFPLAWIGEAINDEEKTIKILAKSGVIDNYTDTVKLRWDDSKMGIGPTGRSIKQNKTVISQDLVTDQTIFWKENIKKENLNSVISIPFELGAGRRAVISIYSDRKNAFDSKEKQILVRLAHDLSNGVQAIRAQKEYQKTLEELRTSQEKFSKIFEITPNGISLADLETGKFVEVNEGMSQITGYSREEMIGKSAHDLDIWTIEGDRSQFDFEITHNKQLTDYEMEFRRKDGSVGFGILKARTFMVDHREMIMSVITDLTEQRQMIETQHFVDERYQLMTDNMSEVIWVISAEFSIKYVSAAVQSLLAYSPTDLLGKEWGTLFTPTSYRFTG